MKLIMTAICVAGCTGMKPGDTKVESWSFHGRCYSAAMIWVDDDTTLGWRRGPAKETPCRKSGDDSWMLPLMPMME